MECPSTGTSSPGEVAVCCGVVIVDMMVSAF